MRFILLFFICFSYFNITFGSDSLKVLSYNLQFLQRGILFANQVERANAFVEWTSHQDYDLLLLQEVFDKKCLRILNEGLLQKYSNSIQPFPRQKFFMSSNGLLIFSKVPIEVIDKVIYDSALSFDKLSKKGAQILSVTLKGKTINIVHTHLQSGFGIDKNEIRTKQLNQIKLALKQHEINQNYLIIGDLNIDKYTNDQYKMCLELLNVKDKLPDNKLKHSYSHKNTNVSKSNHEYLFDYCWANLTDTTKVVRNLLHPKYIKKQKENDISDHYPLKIIIKQ